MYSGIKSEKNKSKHQKFKIVSLYLGMCLILFSAVFACVDITAKAGDSYSLTEDVELTADELSALLSDEDIYGIETNSYKLTIIGNVTIDKNIHVGEGGKLEVRGDLTTAFRVEVDDNGTLIVTGDYTINKDGLGGIGIDATVNVGGTMTFSGTGYVYSTNGYAVINVGKDLIFDSTTDTYINDATWNVSGNVIQKREKGGRVDLKKLVLKGEGEKSLMLQSNSRVEELYLENGMELDVPLYYTCNTINSDITIKTGDKTVFLGIGIPEERNITVEGDMVVTDEKVGIADGASLKVKGNYTQKKEGFGGIGANAKVEVDGTMTFSGTGYVYSTNNSAVISIGSDFVYESASDTYINDATWIVKGNVLQQEKTGKLEFKRLEMLTKDTDVIIKNGKVAVLVLAYGKSNFDIIPDDCYDKLIATTVVTLDAGEGQVEPKTITVTTDEVYGTLPVPEYDGRAFLGWYTEEEDGEIVNDSTKVTAVDDHTLYAHWGDGLKEGEERISPEDKDRVKKGEPGSKIVTKSIKLSKKERIDVSVSVNYLNNVAVYTGKKIDVVNILRPSIDLTPLMELVELQEGTSASDLFIVDYVTKNIKAGDAKFYAKISLTKDAKNRMSKADLKKLKKVIKGVNSALKADPCAYWINPASVLDCDAKVIVKLKAGKIQLKKDGTLKNIKKVTVTIGDKTYKLTKKSYELSGVDEAAGTVKLKGKGNYTGTVIVEINK